MKTSVIIRFVILGVIWLALAGTVLVRGGVTLYNLFVVVAAAIIIFVPMYKKYVKNDKD
ncbi:MAG: hypothetical protein K2N16_06185 [Muribaculaceae bacterium]|nr:hypothetical protein [Muribaculaceae bacterium]